MKTKTFFAIALLCASSFAQGAGGGFTGPVAKQSGGYTGPGAGKTPSTVAGLENLKDDSWVTLRGVIIEALPDEKYKFQDATGTVTLEIDHKVWKGLEVGAADTVQVYGEFDKSLLQAHYEVEVKEIKKL
jgi:uncharacterized protein (TIGR00156 family)